MTSNIYSTNFYEEIRDGSKKSAQVIVPTLMKLVSPKSVVDIGCGVGTWLSAFRESGILDTVGVDGDYVDTSLLAIPEACFVKHDLKNPFTLPRKFDLVMSVEVAEHLPEKHANDFVDTLTSLGDVVFFSAAIPFQGGTHHVNLQWPEYWAKLFQQRGYVPIDCIRNMVWDNDSVEYWYSQNAIIYVRSEKLQNYPELAAHPVTLNPAPMVHPKLYMETLRELTEELDRKNAFYEKFKTPRDPSKTSLESEIAQIKQGLGLLPELIFRAIKKRLSPTATA